MIKRFWAGAHSPAKRNQRTPADLDCPAPRAQAVSARDWPRCGRATHLGMSHDEFPATRADVGWTLRPDRPNRRQPLFQHCTETACTRVLHRANLPGEPEFTKDRNGFVTRGLE